MSSPVITRVMESLAQVCYSWHKRKINAIFTQLYWIAFPSRSDTKSYIQYSMNTYPICDSQST